MRIFVVGTEFFASYGGIQYINRLLARALAEMGCRTPLEIEAFSYIDGPQDLPPLAVGGAPLRWHGAHRRRGRLAWMLARRLAARQPDLVLFTHVSLLPLAQLARTLAPAARVSLLAHGTEVWRPLEGRVARLLPRVDAFVAPSIFTARRLTELHGIPSGRIAVIPHGLDPDWGDERITDSAAPESAASSAGPLLLSVTRLSRADREGKGFDLVLQALPTVAARIPEVRCRVVGGGSDLPRLGELIRQLGLEGRAELAGACRDDLLRHAYAEAAVFVLPTQVEGFGIVFLEAMYNRLPVVAVRASATPEVVEHGVTGLLVSPGNADELAAALTTLLANTDLRRDMGEAGRRRVEQLFSFEKFADRWERWLAAQVPEAMYAARLSGAFRAARSAAGAA